MRLRTAIKIMRLVECDCGISRNLPRWRRSTVNRAESICRRKWTDYRVPYIPDDDERLEAFGLSMSVLADAIIDDDAKRDEFKSFLWAEIRT